MALGPGQVALTKARLGVLRLDAGRLNALLEAPAPAFAPTPVPSFVGGPYTLAWSADGATSYDVLFGPAPTFPPLVSADQTATTYALPPLTAGTLYYWRIITRNPFGSTPGPIWTFTAAVPPAPTTPSPPTGATGVPVAPTLTWTGSPAAVFYRVYLAPTGSPPLLVADGLTTPTFAPGVLQNGTAYTWRVEAINSVGATATTWTFTTAPLELSDPTPPQGSTTFALRPTLTWSSPTGTEWDVYFSSADSPLALVAANLTARTWTPPADLVLGTIYQWQVVARNAAGSATGPAWAFRVATDTRLVADIAGTTPRIRRAGLEISDDLNDQPNTASFVVDGTAPTVGQVVRLGLGSLTGDALLFAGTIDSVEETYEGGRPALTAWRVRCLDYWRRLNRQKVRIRYAQQSATAIVLDLMTRYAVDGFTTTAVASGLPTVQGGIDFTEEDLGVCLRRVAARIGAYWYVDYQKDLHFFLTEALAVPDPLVAGSRLLLTDPPVLVERDMTQIRTRVFVEGGGSTARNAVAPGGIEIPVTDGSWYLATGGTVVSGPQRITYTGKGAAGGPAPPTATAQAVVGNLSGGPYSYVVTQIDAGVESPLSVPSTPVSIPGITPPATAITVTDSTAGFLAPPGTAPNPGTPSNGGSQAIGTHAYGVTFVNANGGETTLGPTAVGTTNVLQGRSGSMPISVNHNAGATFGFLPGASVAYLITYGNAAGQTTQGTLSASVTMPSTGDRYFTQFTVLASFDSRVTFRQIFRSVNGGPYLFYMTVSGNTNYDTVDYYQTSSPTPPLPTTNTAVYANLPLTAIPTGPAGTVARRLYRTRVNTGSPFYRLKEISNNTTTTDSDADADSALGVQTPPATNQTGGGALDAAWYRWIVTFYTAIGESLAGPAASTAITSGAAALSAIPVSADPRVVGRRLYRTISLATDVEGSPYYLEATIANNTATTATSVLADSALGPSYTGAAVGANAGQIAVSGIAIGGAGVTARKLYRTLAGGSAYQLVATINNNTATTYQDNVADGSLGTVAPGDVVTALTGIPASGPGAILYEIAQGDDVNLFVTCNDTAAQTALAALEGAGSPGIYEHVMQDRRLSVAEATAQGNADLALFSRPIVTVRYATRDPKTRSGKTVRIDLPALHLAGDFVIRAVQITEIDRAPGLAPRYTVEASSVRYSFEDLLRQVLLTPSSGA